MKCFSITGLAALILMLTGPGAVAVVTQDFDDFSPTMDAPQSVTINDWTVNETYVITPSQIGWNAVQGANVALLPDSAFGSGVSGNNSYVQTPELTNGIGSIAFYLRNFADGGGSGPFVARVAYSTNDTDWVTVGFRTNTTATSWTAHSVTLDVYDPVRVRIYKGVTTTDGSWVGLDAIATTEAPARVLIQDITTDPQEPLADQAVTVSAQLLPSALASNLNAEVRWTTGAGTNSIAMSYDVGTARYVTDSPIPGQGATVPVEFTIHVTFEGPDALSPATASSGYVVGERFAESAYDAMAATGAIEGPMVLIADHTWEGVFPIASPIVSAQFEFAGTPTNNPSATDLWGDDSQVQSAILPFEDTAGPDGAPIAIDSLPAGQVLLRFNASDLSYRVAPITYQSMDTWTENPVPGTYSDAGWGAVGAAIGSPEGSTRRAVLLEDSGSAYLRSPELPDGIGEIAFWYRLTETGSVDFAEAIVQVADHPAGDWTTVTNLPAIQVTVFNRFVMTMNDRQNRYVRILNTDGARLALDDIGVSHPGAGVTFTNLMHDPAQPAASDPVQLHVDTDLLNGASNLELTAHYRTGSAGPFSALTMTNHNGTFTTVSPVPAASGDGPDGTGTVEYYVTATFDGFEAAFGSPADYPFGGPAAPVAFAIERSRVVIGNDTVIPFPVTTGTDAHIAVDIEPLFDASDIAPTLYYRVGGSGGYTSIAMQPDTPPHGWRTAVPIPGQNHPGTPVEYYVTAAFDGAHPVSPTNFPTGGAATPRSFVYRAAPTDGIYTSMTVAGDVTGALDRVLDGYWFGVVPIGALADADIRFVSQNGGTLTWRDPDQSRTALPIFSSATAAAVDDVRIDAAEAGWLAFSFNEDDSRYGIQQAEHQDVDAWTGADAFGTYTNAGWVITRARTTDDPDLAFAGRSVQFEATTSLRAIASPELPAGIGTVSFRYRNTETNGMAPAELEVQVWHETLATWQTEHTITNILSPDYRFAAFDIQNLDRKRVRIVAPAGAPTAQLLIDTVTVTRPGATVTFDDLLHTPTNPTITNTVDVSVTIAPLNGAADLEATLWFRAADSDVWDAIAMTENTPGQFTATQPIPRGPAAAMHYYVACSYVNPATGDRLTASEPLDRTGLPADYTNTDVPVAREFFADYPISWNPHQYQAASGWSVNDAYIIPAGDVGWTAAMGTKVALLPGSHDPFAQPSGVSGTNSYVETPWLERGAGRVSFHLYNLFPNDGTGPYVCDVRYTTNDVDWLPLATITNPKQAPAPTVYTVTVGSYVPVRLRFYRGATGAHDSWIGIDDIRITFPPAYVTAGAFQIHPAYPSRDQSVEISATIESATQYHPAFNIAGQIQYRLAGASTWSTAIPMMRQGNHFRTLSGIPPHDTTSIVEYRLLSAFRGYHGTGENRSPMTFAPPDPTYTVRRHASDYQTFTATVNGEEQTFRQTADGEWETIITFFTPETDANVGVSGFDFYDGTNTTEGLAGHWGDPDQIREQLPYAGTMQPGATNLPLNGTHSGQMVLRFNEQDGTYIILGAAFQDFDRWFSSADEFEASFSGLAEDYTEQAFAPPAWPADVYGPTEQLNEDFEGILGLGEMEDYEYLYYPPPAGWYPDYPDDGDSPAFTQAGIGALEGVIMPQAGLDRALMLMPQSNRGWFRTERDSPFNGVGTVAFNVRSSEGAFNTNVHGFSNTASRENIMVEARLRATEIADGNIGITGRPGLTYLSILARYQDAQNYYELRLTQVTETQFTVALYRMQAGVLSGPSQTRTYTGSIKTDAAYRLILSNYHHSTERVHSQLWRNTTPGNEQTWAGIWTHDDTSGRLAGPGSFGFRTLDAGIRVDSVTAGHANIQRVNGWPTTRDWTSTRNHDGWKTRNVWIENQSTEFRMRWHDTDLAPAIIRSPLMADGLGTIRFRYRRQNPGSTGRLLLQYAYTDSEHDWEWETFDSLTVTSTGWQNYSTFAGAAANTNVYLRIVNSNLEGETPSRVDIDDIVIEPNRNLTYRNLFAAQPTGWTNADWTWNSTAQTYGRAGYIGPPLGLDIEFSPTFPFFTWETVATITNLSAVAYQRINYPMREARRGVVRVRHRDGNGSLIFDNIRIMPWRARDARTDTNGWTIYRGWIEPKDDRVNVLQFDTSRTIDTQYIQTPLLTNGAGRIEFEYTTEGPGPFQLDLQYSEDGATWHPIESVTDASPGSWGLFSGRIDRDGELYLRLEHTSASNTIAWIDNIIVNNLIHPEGDFIWNAYNALISPNDDYPLFKETDNVKSAFLNLGPGPYPGTPSTPSSFPDAMPHIESAELPDGIGQIRFWYRSWDGQPGTILVQTAPTPGDEATWTLRAAVSNVTNTGYALFDEQFYLRDERYLRIVGDTSDPAKSARIGLDNVLVTAPYGASLTIRDVMLDPAIPLVGEPVHVEAELGEFFLEPEAIQVFVDWRSSTNDWGLFTVANRIAMEPVAASPGSMRFRTPDASPIPHFPIDTVIQYRVVAEFGGFFSEESSPVTYTTFSNPSWYEPVDLNAGQPVTTPYYFVFSSLPGHVWINELNVTDMDEPVNFGGNPAQYVELAGLSGINIGNWQVRVFDTGFNVVGDYAVPWGTVINNTTNHYGFWVLGDAEFATAFPGIRDATLTNPIPVPGGVQLLRSMGAIEHAVSFDSYEGEGGHLMANHPTHQFVYIGPDDDWFYNSPLAATGSGSNLWDFSAIGNWSNSGLYTPGSINDGQVLLDWYVDNGTNEPPLQIGAAWVDGTFSPPRITFTVHANTNSYIPRPYYSTNLLSGIWTEAPNANHSRDGNTYTVWGDLMTGPNGVFYRIEDTAP